MASLWFEEMWEMSVSSVLVRQLEKQKGEKKVLDTEREQQHKLHRTQIHSYSEEKDREQMRTRPENVNADGPTSGETEVFQAQAYLI